MNQPRVKPLGRRWFCDEISAEPGRGAHEPADSEVCSLVYRIPAWDVLEPLQAAGFSEACMHHIGSWKHGVLGSDLPGVLVIEAEL